MFYRMRADSLAKRASDAFGEWLSGPEWQWYITLTFRAADVSLRAADGHWQSWLNSLILTCKARGLERPFYFRVTEFQVRGAVHYHALIGGVGNIRRNLFKHLWEINGFAKIEKYEAGKGANYYVGKYLTKASCDFRVSCNLTKHLEAYKISGASQDA